MCSATCSNNKGPVFTKFFTTRRTGQGYGWRLVLFYRCEHLHKLAQQTACTYSLFFTHTSQSTTKNIRIVCLVMNAFRSLLNGTVPELLFSPEVCSVYFARLLAQYSLPYNTALLHAPLMGSILYLASRWNKMLHCQRKGGTDGLGLVDKQ